MHNDCTRKDEKKNICKEIDCLKPFRTKQHLVEQAYEDFNARIVFTLFEFFYAQKDCQSYSISRSAEARKGAYFDETQFRDKQKPGKGPTSMRLFSNFTDSALLSNLA